MAAEEFSSGDIKKEELEDITTCCICTDVYTDPKALPCIHTFCMKCLQQTGLTTGKGPGDEMPCPICRRLFKIPSEGFHGLPKNFFIERLIQVAQVSGSPTASRALCTVCLEESKEEAGKETPVAETYCVDCNHKLCIECCSDHRNFKMTKNHKLIPVNEHKGEVIICERHEKKILDVYCADCKTVVCAICFIHDHKNHEGYHVSKFVDGFRKQIERNTEVVNKCISQAQLKQTEFLKVKEEMQQRVTNLECDVANRKDEIKQFTDKHANSLLQGLISNRQSKLKEIKMASSDTDDYLSCLQSYNSYCQRIMEKGSAGDICRAVSDLSVRAVELQQQCQPIIDLEIQSFNFCFRKSELEEFLEEVCGNLIGEIEEECDSKPKKISKKITSAGKLRQELEMTKAASKKKILFLEQKLEQQRKTLTEEKEELVKQIKEQRRLNLIAQLRYKSDPVLVQTIKTNDGKQKNKWIRGLTILDKELFVLSEESSEVEVYNSMKFSLSRRWNLKELIRPKDIGSCNRNKCLYIFDQKGPGKSKEILKAGPNGKLIKKWSTGRDYGEALSVTYESNVILTVFEKNKLNEYSPDGQLIRVRYLSSGICHPWHAIKLTNGNFLVSHGWSSDVVQRLCVVDGDGKLKKSFGGNCGSTIGQMNCPGYFAVDEKGCVIVAESGNSRVLLLDPDLEFMREILSLEKHGLRTPQRILLDHTSNRLIVADNEWDSSRILVFEFK